MPFEEYYSHLFCISAGIPAVDEGVWESLLAAADALTLISAVNNETSEQLQHTKQLLDTLGIRMYSIREGNVKECLEPLVL